MIHSTRTLNDAIFWSVAPFRLEDEFQEATQEFTVKQAGCFNEKDKTAITSMIDKFQNGGTKAFEAKIAQLGLKVVAETTGRKAASRVKRRYSMEHAQAPTTLSTSSPSIDVHLAP